MTKTSRAPNPQANPQSAAPTSWPTSVRLIDSHTEGEPTRVVIDGWPQPAGDDMAARRDDLASRFDGLRRAVVCEPRGHDAIVGALLTPPTTPGAATGVVFFNNAGCLGMCGHGLIGVVRTLEHLGRIEPGEIQVDTPVGVVGAVLEADGAVTIRNVPSRCAARDVEVDVPGLGKVRGDVAWGGNWFFLADLSPERLGCGGLELAAIDVLLDATRRILAALDEQGVTGDDGGRIDHVELFGPPHREDADSRNFVLCPGGEYDRSPCGTGTSAKMAVLHARGKLDLGTTWRQESITGGLFEGRLERGEGDCLIPYIRARAFVTAESTLLFHPEDPFRGGFSRLDGAPSGGG